jgi:tetratricopeptide (TPR) repeat protein
MRRTQTAQSPSYTLQHVREAADREDWEAALGMFRQMERSFSLNPAFHYWRGLVLMHKDRLAEAKDALRRALYCDSQFSLAHYLLGEVMVQERNLKEARRCWQIALQTAANRPGEQQILDGDALTVDELRVLIQSRLDAAELK